MKEGYAEQLLNDGLDESAEELVGMGGIDRLTNGVFRREGGIAKRPGFTFPTSSAVNTLNDADNAGHTLVARDGALRVLRKTSSVSVTSLDGGVGSLSLGNVFPGYTDVAAQISDGRGFATCDATVGRRNGVLLACIVGSLNTTTPVTPSVRVDVIEVESGDVIFQGSISGSGVCNARVVWRESAGVGKFLVFYESGTTDVKVALVDPVARTLTQVSTALNNGDGAAGGPVAVCVDSTSTAHTFAAWCDDTGTNIRIKRVDFAGAVSTSTTVDSVIGCDFVDICQSGQHPEWLHVVFTTSVTGYGDVSLFGLRADFTGTPTTPVVAASTTNTDARICSVSVFDQGSTLTVAAGWDSDAFHVVGEVLYRFASYVSNGGTPTLPSYTLIGTDTNVLPSSLLLSHGLSVYADDDTADTTARPVLAVARTTDDLGDTKSRLSIPTSVLMSHTTDGAVVESLLNTDEAFQGAVKSSTSTSILGYRLPGVTRDSATGNYYVAQLVLEELPTAKTPQYGIKLMRLTYNTLSSYTRPLPRASLGSLTYLGGNLLRSFGGHHIGEAVPILPPAAPLLSQAATGSLDLTSTYSYRCVLQYEDAQGLIHRSAPSPPVSFTLTSTNQKIVLSWAKLFWPTELLRATTGQEWRLEVYRTEGNGAAYFFEQELSVVPNSAYTVNSTVSDATITANKILYTEGDVLPNECPPPLKALCAVGNRLFGIDATDPRSIVFSKELEEGVAAEFNAALGFRLEASASEPVALGALNDLLVIFTEDEAWAISTHGGPDALGVGSFGLPERIATDCGASGPESVVSIPLGLLVHGRAGMRLLAPGTSASVAVVADSASGDYTVVRALHVPRREEAWFILRGTPDYGRILVVSYARGRVRWMNWNVRDSSAGSLPDIRDADVVDGVPYLLTHSTTGSNREYFLTYLNEDTYRDGALGSSGAGRIHVSVRTRWFKPEGAFGDSRFRALHVLGKYGAGHDLQAKIYVMDLAGSPDDDDGGTDWLRGTADWTAAKLANDDRAIAVRRRLRSQRGAAVRAELTLSDVSSAHTDAGPVLHAVGWDFAVRGSTAPRGASYESE